MKVIEVKFNQAISSYINTNDKLALAVSGGMDSMSMLHLCLSSGKISRQNMMVVSVDHKIRGLASSGDVGFVKKFCDKNKVKFISFCVDVPALALEKKQGLEQAARDVRREIFSDLVNSQKVDKILLAHHKDDNAESICMHIFRGSGLNGLKGMQVLSNGYLFRPMLYIARAEIEEYVKLHSVPFVIDKTNSDTSFTRNAFRHEVLPLIKKHYSGAVDALCNLSQEASKALDNVYIDDFKVNIVDDKAYIELQPLKCAYADKYVLLALEKLDIRNGFYKKNILEIIELANKKTGASLDLPNNTKAIKEYNCVCIYKIDNQAVIKKKELPKLEKLKKGEAVDFSLVPKVLYVDSDCIPKTAIWRNRKDGDIFSPCGGNTKKLKDYLIDKKIPKLKRGDLYCLADGNIILAIEGVEIGDILKITATTKNILKITKKV